MSSTSSTVGCAGAGAAGDSTRADVQLLAVLGHFHPHARARADLVGGHQGGQRLGEVRWMVRFNSRAPYSALVPFLQQELARFERHFQGEGAVAEPRVDVVLQVGDLLDRGWRRAIPA